MRYLSAELLFFLTLLAAALASSIISWVIGGLSPEAKHSRTETSNRHELLSMFVSWLDAALLALFVLAEPPVKWLPSERPA